MADWYWMPFGVVSRVSCGMGEYGVDRQMGRDSFGGKFGVSHCNQWGFDFVA